MIVYGLPGGEVYAIQQRSPPIKASRLFLYALQSVVGI